MTPAGPAFTNVPPGLAWAPALSGSRSRSRAEAVVQASRRRKVRPVEEAALSSAHDRPGRQQVKAPRRVLSVPRDGAGTHADLAPEVGACQEPPLSSTSPSIAPAWSSAPGTRAGSSRPVSTSPPARRQRERRWRRCCRGRRDPQRGLRDVHFFLLRSRDRPVRSLHTRAEAAKRGRVRALKGR